MGSGEDVEEPWNFGLEKPWNCESVVSYSVASWKILREIQVMAFF